jgi:hypothetical protein
MADHPNGTYNYTSVVISNNATVTFTPNVNNTPVVWLVQSNCSISGTVNVAGNRGLSDTPGQGGPGGFRGGNAGSSGTDGLGPGGGGFGIIHGGPGSYGSLGQTNGFSGPGAIGSLYGSIFVIPLQGGSGGGGSRDTSGGGGGGGGALLIAASGTIQVSGTIDARGGGGPNSYGGGGSGGAVRLVALTITGNGKVYAKGGYDSTFCTRGGDGRVRFDTYLNNFVGTVDISYTQGTQFVIIPTNGPGAQLTITSVGGVPISASPTGVITTPDAVIPALQANPIPIVVQCTNIPTNTQITVTVTPVNGPAVSATGHNNTGTLASSSATVWITMPHGGGFISATAATSP